MKETKTEQIDRLETICQEYIAELREVAEDISTEDLTMEEESLRELLKGEQQ